jgi:pyridoxamine 5'-phosphate oxidase
MTEWNTLDEVVKNVWQMLGRAAVDKRSPWHSPTLCTRGTHYPNPRTVILRKVAKEQRQLTFHTDRRAEKVREIEQDPQISWHFWYPRKQIQLRLYGQAYLHFDDEIADQAWKQLPLPSRTNYSPDLPPGEAIADYEAGIACRTSLDAATPDASENWRSAFGLGVTTIARMEWLWLARSGHRRAAFQWEGEGWQGEWLVP